MRTLWMMLKVLVLALLIVAVSGAMYQWYAAAADRRSYPAPGQMFEVDRVQMHLDCRGSGAPTVILEAGLGSGSTTWALVHDELSEKTRVCAYDRVGMDWSEDSGEPFAVETVAGRLHGLLSAAGLHGPHILVGMSAGGVFVREYYGRYPEKVIGMVLIDSSHEQQGDRLTELGGSWSLDQLLTACSWMQPLGMVRLLGLMDIYLEQYAVPEKLRAVALANANQSRACAGMRRESRGFEREVRDAQPPAHMGDLPLIVLSQGKAPEAIDTLGLTLEQAQKLALKWDELQNELAALSTRGERRIARESGHVIQFEQPQIVIDAVQEMVLNLR